MHDKRSRSQIPALAAAAITVALATGLGSMPQAWGAAPLPAGLAGITTATPELLALGQPPTVLDQATVSLPEVAAPWQPDQQDPYSDPEIVWPGALDADAIPPTPLGDEPEQPATRLDSGLDPTGLTARLSGVVKSARTLIGRPYVWGGTTPAGFDCSGFTSFLYARYNIRVPRTAEEQFHAVNKISRTQAIPGDLVFFPRSDGFVYHVAVYIGSGMIIEARNPRVGVLLDPIWASNVSYGTVRSLGRRPGGFVTGRYNPAPISTGVGFSIGAWNGSAAGNSSYAWIGAPGGTLPAAAGTTRTPRTTTPPPSETPDLPRTPSPTASASPTSTPKPTASPGPEPSPSASSSPTSSPTSSETSAPPSSEPPDTSEPPADPPPTSDPPAEPPATSEPPADPPPTSEPPADPPPTSEPTTDPSPTDPGETTAAAEPSAAPSGA